MLFGRSYFMFRVFQKTGCVLVYSLCPQLFASGIYCKNSPTYDDLFGFAVEDVIEERRRGKKLVRITDLQTNAQAQIHFR